MADKSKQRTVKSLTAKTMLLAGVTAFSQSATAQGVGPLELAFYDLPGMSTANLLPKGTLMGIAGQHQANPAGSTGTGNQLYFFGAEYALTDRLQFGIMTNKFADPVTIAGASNDMFIRSVSLSAAYQLYDSGSVKVTARGSFEHYSFASELHGSRTFVGSDTQIGSLHLPISVDVSDSLQVHVSPGVSFFPDNINGVPFFGTVMQVGVGATYKASERFSFFGSYNMPFGDGGNTIDRATGGVKNVGVWSIGARYLASPSTAIDVYATNGFGTTPATDIVTFYPEGDEVLFGVKLSYTPGLGEKYRKNFRGIRQEPLTARERHLQMRGITMASADTLEAGTAVVSGAYSNTGHYNAAVRFSPDHDLEFGYYVEDLENDGSRGATRTLGIDGEFRWGMQAKIRLLDQNNGSPFSAAVNVEAGREFRTRLGAVYVSVPMSYKISPSFAVMAEPKAVAYGGQKLYGLSVGASAELFDGFDVMAEATALADGEPAVWAVGARYHLGALGLSNTSLELQASNAAGSFGAASMLAQDEVRVTLGLNVGLDGRGIIKGARGILAPLF